MAIASPGVPAPGVQDLPAPSTSEAAPRPDFTPPAASPLVPAPKNIIQPADVPDPPSGDAELDARFLHLLATVRANRPADDLNLIRSSWAFCIQHHGQQ